MIDTLVTQEKRSINSGIEIMPSTNDLPFVSVIVPTMNRKRYLQASLESLNHLDYPKSKIEIIVVDGGSTDGTNQMVSKFFKNTQIIVEKRDGISIARNTGGKNAKGDILAFTDDDCVVDKDWIRNIVTAFRDDKVGAAGGPNILLHPDLFPQKFINSPTLGIFSLGDKKILVDFLITANFAIRHTVFKSIKFDELYGRRKTAIYKWEEDTEICQRLTDAGYKLAYLPLAKVYHNINPSRTGIKYVIPKEFSGGLSHYMVERKHKSKTFIGVSSLRGLIRNTVLFFHTRSITSFCWLLKCCGLFIGSIFLP
jgi:glycosyltransferase involved in cell wall biosynthesis